MAVALARRARLLQRTATFVTKRSNISGLTMATNDDEVCPIRSFAITHPKLATQILAVPSIISTLSPLVDTSGSSCSDGGSSNSNGNPILQRRRGKVALETYLEWRNWNIKTILQRNTFDYENEDYDSAYQLAVGLLSHTLTFPLTLGHYFGRNIHLGITIDDESFRKKKQRIIRNDGVLHLCCVGARAECTLPTDYWKEFLLALASSVRNNNIGTIKSTQQQKNIHKCIIDFVGPDVPHNLVSKTIDLSLTVGNSCNSNDDDDANYLEASQFFDNNMNYRLTMNYHPSYLHEYLLRHRKTISGVTSEDSNDGSSSNDNPLPPPWDGYVLFNPGLGHSNLKSQWYETLLFILRTGKPILLTAHSLVDAERDRAVLEKMLVEDVMNDRQYIIRNVLPFTTYVENPYASRMRYVDPFPTTNTTAKTTTMMMTKDLNGIHHVIIRPNQYALFLP
jgi:hypothetical protein